MTRRTAAKPLSPRVKAMIEPMMMPQSPPRAIPSRNTRLRKNVIVDHLFFVYRVIRMRYKTLETWERERKAYLLHTSRGCLTAGTPPSSLHSTGVPGGNILVPSVQRYGRSRRQSLAVTSQFRQHLLDETDWLPVCLILRQLRQRLPVSDGYCFHYKSRSNQQWW